MKKLGFTNIMCLLLIGILFVGLIMGFILAVLSIRHDYLGPLACFTVVFTPIGTGINVVLAAAVGKSKAENTGADGEGIVFAQAMKEDNRTI